MSAEFTFFDYVDADGINTIRAWMDGPGRAARAKFNNRLRNLEAAPPGDWSRPYVDTLTGECAGLFEVRVRVSRQQYRILGFHGPGQRLPTLALCITKAGNEVPPEECSRALRIKDAVEAQPLERRERHDFA